MRKGGKGAEVPKSSTKRMPMLPILMTTVVLSPKSRRHCGLTKSMPRKEMESEEVKYLTDGGHVSRRSPMIETVVAWYLFEFKWGGRQ